MTNVFRAIEKRGSCRNFLRKPVSRKIIRRLVSLAQMAPSSCNLQLTEFIIVDDPQLRSDLALKVTGKFNWGTTFIVFIYDRRFTVKRHAAVTSLGAMMQNILLTVSEFGLAACPMAGFDKDEELRRILKIPETYEIALIMAIGYPTEREEKNRSVIEEEKITHWNYWTEKNNRLKENLILDNWNLEDIINYRRRMAAVYLYGSRFKLNSFNEKVYLEAFSQLTSLLPLDNSIRLLDLVTYDGLFAKSVIDHFPKMNLTVSDYFDYTMQVFTKNYPFVKKQLIGASIKEEYNLVTCVHKIEFTPDYQNLLRLAQSYLKNDGYLYLTTTCEPFFRRAGRKFWYIKKKYWNREIINVYEQNPFYKIGPFSQRSFFEVVSIAGANGLKLLKFGRKKVLTHEFSWMLFSKGS